MPVNDLTEYLKTAFEYKNNGKLKNAIDYFYKALALDNSSVEIMHELALLYTRLCQYERAMSFYEQIILKDKNNNLILFEYAKLLKLKNDYEKSETILCNLYNSGYEIESTAQELFPLLLNKEQYQEVINFYNKYSNRIKDSNILYYMALSYEKLRNQKLAEEYYLKSLNADETNIRSGAKVVEFLLNNKKTDEAEKLATKLLSYGENDSLYYLMGEITYLKSDIDEAIRNYCYAIKINPQKAVYYFKLAILFSLKGFFFEAEECYCRAITLEPENILYNYSLAYMYYTNGKNELAEKIADYILDINNDYANALAVKALIYIEKNESVKVRQIIQKLDKLQEKTDFSYYVQSVYYAYLDMWEKASEFINKAIELNNESLEYKYLLAYYCKSTGCFDKAQNLCEQIIQLNPKYIQSYIMLAEIQKETQNYPEAVKNINKALELDKNQPETYEILADIYNSYGDYEKALENYKIALSMAPNEEKYYEKVGKCYYKSGNYKEAYVYFKEAAEIDVQNAEYRYYMAKCNVCNDEKESALANFSFMKRLAPNNIEYIKDYAKFLYSIGKNKAAKNMIKSLLSDVSDIEKKELKKLLYEFK